MPSFDNVRDALEHCIEQLIPARHKFIVDILGEREAAAGKHNTLQVITQHLVKNDGDPGLAMHLPIDPELPESAAWVKHLDANYAGLYERIPIGPIGTTFIHLGRDVNGACQLVEFLLTKVFQYPADASFTCTVHDEGPIDDPR